MDQIGNELAELMNLPSIRSSTKSKDSHSYRSNEERLRLHERKQSLDTTVFQTRKSSMKSPNLDITSMKVISADKSETLNEFARRKASNNTRK